MDREQAIKALDVPLPANDADASTVREYLKELLVSLLVEEESFSGKRPFGNSGWQYEILEPLHAAGFASAQPDDNERANLFDALVDAL